MTRHLVEILRGGRQQQQKYPANDCRLRGMGVNSASSAAGIRGRGSTASANCPATILGVWLALTR